MNLREIIKLGVDNKASDIHITEGVPPIYRVNGNLVNYSHDSLSEANTRDLARIVLGEDGYDPLYDRGEMDVSYTFDGICRCRINTYLDSGNISMAIRIIPFSLPDYNDLKLPSIVENIINLNSGLVLVTGQTGSGKSTTISSIVDLINKTRASHIITIEDPIEYLHRHDKSIINQREIGSDTMDYLGAIRSSLRQDPDVIVIGEMRDPETIAAAIYAAETGHLVLSTIHTDSAINTILRIVDSFPEGKQDQIRVRLASVMNIIISQKLLQGSKVGRVLATEVMVTNNAIRNIIRENKIHQIYNILQTGQTLKMNTMDQSLLELYRRKLIDKDVLLRECVNKDYIKKYI